MRKFVAESITAISGVVMLVACGRPGSPIAPGQGIPQTAAVQAIRIAGGEPNGALEIGQTMQLTAVAQLIDGTEQDITSLATWVSDDPFVATVSSGLVTAVAPGLAQVRASYQNATGGTTFRIVDRPNDSSGAPGSPASGSSGGTSPSPGTGQLPNGPTPGGPSPTSPAPLPGTPPTVQRLVIEGANTVPAGKSSQFRATAYMSDGSQRDVTSSSDWRSDNTLIGSMSQSGVFTGVIPGSNIVSASYNGATASQPVQVTPF